MARAGQKSSYIEDPERRAYHRALRTIRNQVYLEHEKELAESGFFKRLLLRFRMEKEIKRRAGQLPSRPPA